MTVKLLNEHHLAISRIKGGGTGSYESTLVKMPHCWKSRVTVFNNMYYLKLLNIHYVASDLRVQCPVVRLEVKK